MSKTHPFVLSPTGVRHRVDLLFDSRTACGVEHDAPSSIGMWWWLDADPDPAVLRDCLRCDRLKRQSAPSEQRP